MSLKKSYIAINHYLKSTINYKGGFKIFLPAIFILLNIAGCNLFSTRNPASPDSNNSKFVPPTSPLIVVSNFNNAVIENNVDDFIYCLSDSATQSTRAYHFFPASDALSRYPSLFDNWTINSERRSFTSMVGSLIDGTTTDMKTFNSKLEINSTDSAVYTADYIINLKHNQKTIPTKCSGTFRLTIVPKSDGQWCIQNWYDIKYQNDTIPDSWSIIKAQFYN
jgi:hypothetical protein